MKLKKKSGLIGVVVALSAASLISVGFASWVISQGDEKVVTGTIAVDDVTNKTYSITYVDGVTGSNLDDKIVFGVDTSSFTGTPWLTNDGTIGDGSESSVENLTASFTFSIDNVDAATASGNSATLGTTGYTLTATLASSAYDAALSTGLTYNANTYTNLVGAKPTPVLTFDSTSHNFTCTVTFSWGAGFGGVNPYKYFNEKDNNATNVAEAQNKLGALATLNATYTITLTVAIPTV